MESKYRLICCVSENRKAARKGARGHPVHQNISVFIVTGGRIGFYIVKAPLRAAAG